jgi:hypothetical protein
MKKLLICMAAAATVATAAPAMAQVGFYADGPGVDVRIGRDRGDHWRGDGWHRGRDYGHHYGWYRQRGCREVTVRERLPDGTMVVRRRERC